MRPSTPSQESLASLATTQYCLVASCIALVHTNAEDADREGLALIERMCEGNRVVIGNRPLSSAPSWKDLQLVLEGYLRLCLAYLEDHQ